MSLKLAVYLSMDLYPSGEDSRELAADLGILLGVLLFVTGSKDCGGLPDLDPGCDTVSFDLPGVDFIRDCEYRDSIFAYFFGVVDFDSPFEVLTGPKRCSAVGSKSDRDRPKLGGFSGLGRVGIVSIFTIVKNVKILLLMDRDENAPRRPI